MADSLSDEMPFAVFLSNTPISCNVGCRRVIPSALNRGAKTVGFLDVKLEILEIADRFQAHSCASTSCAYISSCQ